MRSKLALSAVWWLLATTAARAHQPGLSYLNLVATPTNLQGRLDLSLRDVESAVGLDVDGNGSVTYEELLQRQPAIGQYVGQRLRFRADGKPLLLRITNHKVAADQDGVYAVVELQTEWPRAPRRLEVAHGLFHDIDPRHRGLMQLEFGGQSRTAVFRIDEPAQGFELATLTRWEQFRQFLWEGVWHIWAGYDHLLFLIALLLPSVLRRNDNGWEGVERFRSAFVQVVKVVTAFTVAHSITLSLAVLELVTLPARAVEAAIAASVAVAAANNLRPLFHERVWLVAFGFGLIHGFGFASALRLLEVPVGTLASTLFSFNAGVELGQLAVVSVFLPLAFAARTSTFYRRHALTWGSAMIVAAACGWFLLRIGGE